MKFRLALLSTLAGALVFSIPAAAQDANVEGRVKKLEKEMQEHARNLEFEKAAAARDELFRLRERAFGADQHGNS